MSDRPIDAFLAELGRLLPRDDERRRRVVAEVGDHLRDLAAEARARGLGDEDAEREAVERFGSPRALARGMRPARRRLPAIAGALAGAAVCGVVAWAEMHGPAGPASAPVAGSAASAAPRIAAAPGIMAAPTIADACLAAWQGDAQFAILRSEIASQSNAVDHEVLVQVGTHVTLDPRTGTVLACAPAAVSGRTDGVWFVATDTASPFG